MPHSIFTFHFDSLPNSLYRSNRTADTPRHSTPLNEHFYQNYTFQWLTQVQFHYAKHLIKKPTGCHRHETMKKNHSNTLIADKRREIGGGDAGAGWFPVVATKQQHLITPQCHIVRSRIFTSPSIRLADASNYTYTRNEPAGIDANQLARFLCCHASSSPVNTRKNCLVNVWCVLGRSVMTFLLSWLFSSFWSKSNSAFCYKRKKEETTQSTVSSFFIQWMDANFCVVWITVNWPPNFFYVSRESLTIRFFFLENHSTFVCKYFFSRPCRCLSIDLFPFREHISWIVIAYFTD